jgi:glycosyltransferase involved in cell wall biosynthesis
MDRINDLPLVSIIVPVYNGEKYVRASLDSILAQTYPRIEVLVMDDASTDSTPDIVASYGNRVTHIRQPQNRGQFDNVNDGIERAQGEYIAVYHADDIYSPQIVEREVAFLQYHSKAGAVFCLDIFIDAVGREYGRLEIPREIRELDLLPYPVVLNKLLEYKNTFLVGPSSMVRASVYREVGGYRGDEFQIASDLEMWVRIARKYPIGIIDEHLFHYRHGHGNLSQKYYHLRTELERYFKIMDLQLEEGGRALARPDALAAYEAHRAEDRLMLAINYYILGQRDQAEAVLTKVQAKQILASPKIQRGRLLLLFFALNGLVRLPRIQLFSDLFYRRWHGRKRQWSN